MLILLAFAFIAGIVTILSPCILPLLPVILTSSVDGAGKNRGAGIVIGFVGGFTFFTLFLSSIVKLTGISPDSLRLVSVIILLLFGTGMLLPEFRVFLETGFSRLSRIVPVIPQRKGFSGGILIGLSLGLLWTPCVGPILAAVISLALTGTVTGETFLITLAYSLGTAIPMFLIIRSGPLALSRVPGLAKNTEKIQKGFAVLMIVAALAILFNLDRAFQNWVLTTFPNYGTGLTTIEENPLVSGALKGIRRTPADKSLLGQPSSNLELPQGPKAPEIIPGGQWFNTAPLTISGLRGKVIVVDFWTYSCINCLRTLPYIKNWYDKYSDKGLVVIGVHSPEFEFEKNPANVGKAISDLGITYPVVQDNNLSTWEAYNNQYWPAEYFIDKNRTIRYTHFGEGDYDKDEEVIRQLLGETGADLTGTGNVSNPQYQIEAQTPETYLGYNRIVNFASKETINSDKPRVYSFTEPLPDDFFAYGGTWTVSGEYAVPNNNGVLELNFGAGNVYLVANPVNGTAKIKVFVDGKARDFGADNKNGVVTVDSDRLYNLVTLPSPGRHTLRLEFDDNSVRVYSFTFG